MMRLLPCFAICFLLAYSSLAQSVNKTRQYGNGVVQVTQYAFPPGDTLAWWPKDLKDSSGYTYTYYIRSGKILRKDENDAGSSTTKTDTSEQGGLRTVTSVHASILHPSYLIDGKTQRAYLFFKKGDTAKVMDLSLAQLSFELFYRRTDSTALSAINLTETPTYQIAGKTCNLGDAVASDGAPVSFLYTREHLSPLSTLNTFFPSSFPYSVMSVRFPVEWSHADGTKGTGTLIFLITSIEAKHLPAELFQLPANEPIVKGLRAEQAYSN